jgi:hypothetical protein
MAPPDPQHVDFWTGAILPNGLALTPWGVYGAGLCYLGPYAYVLELFQFDLEELDLLIEGAARGVLAMGGNGLIQVELVVDGPTHSLGGMAIHVERCSEPPLGAGFRHTCS